MKPQCQRADPAVSVRWLKALIARHRETDKLAVAQRICRHFKLPEQTTQKLLDTLRGQA